MVFRVSSCEGVGPSEAIVIANGIYVVAPPPTRTFVLQKVGISARGTALRSNMLRLLHGGLVEFEDIAPHGSWAASPDGSLLLSFHWRGELSSMRQSVYNRIPGAVNAFIQVHCGVCDQNILIEV